MIPKGTLIIAECPELSISGELLRDWDGESDLRVKCDATGESLRLRVDLWTIEVDA